MTQQATKTIDVASLGPNVGLSRNGLALRSDWKPVKPKQKLTANAETPYLPPNLNDAIEQEYNDPVAANYAKLGIPYAGDPAADNPHRLNGGKNMFSDGNELTLNGGEAPYVPPNLTTNIARDYARRAQRPAATADDAGAAGGCGVETPYVAPTLF